MTEVQDTSELRRILALPRRQWSDADAERLADDLTEILRTPVGTQRLRPVQAIALVEAAQCGGLLAPIRVGGGKTLLSALLPTVLGSTRPLLLLPAKTQEGTRRAFVELRHHWRIPELYRVMSYELLGQPQSGPMLGPKGEVLQPDALERYAPDLIVGDEAHRLRKPTAAVSKRVRRYLNHHPDCRLAALSGTMTTASVLDYAHLSDRALGRGSPLPHPRAQVEAWAGALDDEPTVEPGALRLLGGATCREGFRDRLASTAGVVIFDRPFRDVDLTIDPLPLSPPAVVVEALERLRDAWEMPDGSPLSEALELWRVARQIALGFFYRWDPAPPREWLDARREWSAMCRELVGTNRRNLDSPRPVIDAVDRGLYPQAVEPLARWRAVKDSFEPQPVAVWLDRFAVDAAAAWLEADGICWTEHDAFAEAIGFDYYGAEGRNAFGAHILDAQGPIVASMQSCGEGLNLQQQWHRNLLTSPPSNGRIAEQVVGRTHREGQRKHVTVEWFRTCEEHEAAFTRALHQSRYVQATTGLQQKLEMYGNLR